MAPVWTAILAPFCVAGDRLGALKIVALGLGLAGTALLVGAPSPSEGPNALLATALLALMPISWAVAAILIAKYLSKESPIAVVGVQTWVGALFILPFGVAQLGQPQHWTLPAAVAFAYLVIGGSVAWLLPYLCPVCHLRPPPGNASRRSTPTPPPRV